MFYQSVNSYFCYNVIKIIESQHNNNKYVRLLRCVYILVYFKKLTFFVSTLRRKYNKINKVSLWINFKTKDVLTVYAERLVCVQCDTKKFRNVRRYSKTNWCVLNKECGINRLNDIGFNDTLKFDRYRIFNLSDSTHINFTT